MQLVFDRVGKCDGCIFFDGKWRSETACGACERNPKIKNLKDCFNKPKALVKSIKGEMPRPPADDRTMEVEHENDEAMGDFGVHPAAHRRAARGETNEGHPNGGPSSI